MKRIAIYGTLLLLATMSVLAKSNNAASFLPNHTGEWTSAPKNTLTPDGAICGNGDIGMVFGGNSQHQVIYFSKTDFWKALNGYPNGGLCLVGRLNIRANGLSGASYHITQSINHATVSGSFANALTSYNMEAWCDATSNLAVVRLTAGNAPVQLSVDFESDTGRGATVKSGRKGYIAWTTRQVLGDSLLWESGVAVALRVINGEPQSINLKPHESATVLVQVCSNEENANFLDNAIRQAESITPKKLAKIRTKHCQWWNRFWAQSQVHLGDKDLENLKNTTTAHTTCWLAAAATLTFLRGCGEQLSPPTYLLGLATITSTTTIRRRGGARTHRTTLNSPSHSMHPYCNIWRVAASMRRNFSTAAAYTTP